MTKRMFPIVMLAALLLVTGASRAWTVSVETKDLIVTTAVATLPTDRLKIMAGQAQAMLDRVVAF